MPAAVLAFVVVLAAQQPPTVPPPPPPDDPPAPLTEELPVSLARIQRALSAPPRLQLKEQNPVFRLEIFGKAPTIEDILGEKFWIGPSRYGSMTHAEFMSMVTPQMAQPYAGFSGKYLVAQTALTLMEQWALKAAIKKFRDARADHEREAARKEVLEALAALERARRAAGLDK